MTTQTQLFDSLKNEIQSQSILFGVVGLGYVGLPLSVEFAQKGIRTLGFDLDDNKNQSLNKGKSYIQDIDSDQLADVVDQSLLSATSDMSRLSEPDVISICVPTPLNKTKDPDMGYIFSAVQAIKKTLRKGQLVILESTTYPGTTEEMVLPILEETGLKVGEDFFLAFSPERVDPGNQIYNTVNTPKVMGGITPLCTQLATMAYEIVINTIVPVSSTRTAELVKLYENMFRGVNIALANEMAIMCHKLGVDVWEVIDAAATKPFGFLPFYPGPGLGGHCIPVDPHYLSWKMRSLNYEARFISLAEEVNQYMPRYVVERTGLALNHHQKSINGSKILIIGVAYKKNINDMRESPAVEIISKLTDLGADLNYHDPFIPSCQISGHYYQSVDLNESQVKDSDLILVLSDHDNIDWDMCLSNASLIVDTRRAYKGIKDPKVWYL